MSDSYVSSFSTSLLVALKQAFGQYFVLLKVIAVTLFYLLLDLIIPALVFALAFVFSETVQTVIQGAVLFYSFFLAMKYNGAVAMALAFVSIGQKDVIKIAKESSAEGFGYFWNALQNGVLFLFGQMFPVCLCFLFLSNFIFSPFLFVYENIRGKEAEERSVRIAKGFSWTVLGRTAVLLTIGYAIFALAALSFSFEPYWLGLLIFILGNLFVGLTQNNFIRHLYEELTKLGSGEFQEKAGAKYKLVVLALLVSLLLVYVLVKLWPQVYEGISRII